MGLLDGIIGPVVSAVLGVLNVPVVLSRGARAYNPLTGEDTATETSWTVLASPPAQASQLFTDSAGVSMVQKTGMTFILAQLGTNNVTQAVETIAPDPKTDSIVFSGHTFAINDVTPIYPGTDVAAWKVEVSR